MKFSMLNSRQRSTCGLKSTIDLQNDTPMICATTQSIFMKTKHILRSATVDVRSFYKRKANQPIIYVQPTFSWQDSAHHLITGIIPPMIHFP